MEDQQMREEFAVTNPNNTNYDLNPMYPSSSSSFSHAVNYVNTADASLDPVINQSNQILSVCDDDLLPEDTDSDDEKNAYFDSFPAGYRFKPYDEELVVYYLQRKILNKPLPPNRIKEVKLYKFDPQTLAAHYKPNGEREWYFFTPRDRKYPNGERPNRAAGTGYWKATGADKPIIFKGTKVGFRKALVFYKGKPPKGDKTDWIMHEFRVNAPSKRKREGDMKLDDFVLCRIYQKLDRSFKGPRPRDQAMKEYHQPVQYDHQPVQYDHQPVQYDHQPAENVMIQPEPSQITMPVMAAGNYNPGMDMSYLNSNAGFAPRYLMNGAANVVAETFNTTPMGGLLYYQNSVQPLMDPSSSKFPFMQSHYSNEQPANEYLNLSEDISTVQRLENLVLSPSLDNFGSLPYEDHDHDPKKFQPDRLS